MTQQDVDALKSLKLAVLPKEDFYKLYCSSSSWERLCLRSGYVIIKKGDTYFIDTEMKGLYDKNNR